MFQDVVCGGIWVNLYLLKEKVPERHIMMDIF